MWQDWAMGFMSLLLSMAAYKQVYFGFKEKSQRISRYTAISTAVCLFGYAYVYSTLGCVFAVVVSCSTGLAWGAIIFQVFWYKVKTRTLGDMEFEEDSIAFEKRAYRALSIGGKAKVIEGNANHE